MKILAIESSTHEASCALCLGDDLIEHRLDPLRPSSETLLPAIQRLLAEAGWSFGVLDGLAFGAGPGAFTGVRVAVGVTQGLAFAHDLPVVGIETLAALAYEAASSTRMTGQALPQQILAVLDARMNEIYHANYQLQGDEPIRLQPIRVSGAETIPLPQHGISWMLCGNAAQAYPAFAAKIAGARQAHGVTLPRAAAVVALGRLALMRGEGGAAESALPLYVRDKVAQTVAERLALGGKA